MAAITTIPLTVADINATINHEPRIQDLRLAGILGFSRPRKIRDLIRAHRAALERLGDVLEAKATTHDGTRPTAGRVYWLTKRQALYITTKAETEFATEATIQMVEVFDAYTAGSLQVVEPPAGAGDDQAAIDRLARKWSRRDFRRYRAWLTDHMADLRQKGWTDSAEAALAQLSVDPDKIGRQPTIEADSTLRLRDDRGRLRDGRHLVVVRGGFVTEVRDVAGHCVIDGRNAASVETFMREFVSAEQLAVAASVAVHRLTILARRRAF